VPEDTIERPQRTSALTGQASFEYRHVVTLEETNLLGNVYFAHYLRWQGHCRELFLQRYAPKVFEELDREQALVTTRCSCEYLAELVAFDPVVVRMRAGEVLPNRLTLLFDYVRSAAGREELVARGEQQLAWLRREGERFVPRPVPKELLEAIEAYIGAAGRRAAVHA
jgi:enediyne biosynthesis thioesterase